jgi:hypothetical protein
MVLDGALAATSKKFFFIKTDFRCGLQQTADGSMSRGPANIIVALVAIFTPFSQALRSGQPARLL